jgi:hypothetical protein
MAADGKWARRENHAGERRMEEPDESKKTANRLLLFVVFFD